jgi:putative FmdB family regulatory protein
VGASWIELTRLWHQQITIRNWEHARGNPARPGAETVVILERNAGRLGRRGETRTRQTYRTKQFDNTAQRTHFEISTPMTYEYACTACGHAWEAEQSISAAPLTECPSCKQATAKRQVSGGAGFILKGGGWYADLYSSSGAKKPAEGAADGGTSESKSADTKSADKPKTDSATTSASTTASAPSGSSSTGSKSSGASSG